MSREIKFRAWDNKRNEMWNAWDDGSYFTITSTGFVVNALTRDPLKHIQLMQFTGLLDKNGKEIYEGDIVHEFCSNPDVNWTWEVYYDQESAWFWCRKEGEVLGQFNCGDDPAYPSWSEYEVIGNIYENPELVKSV